MTNPAIALLDYAPLARSASLFGLHGINFGLALAASLAELGQPGSWGAPKRALPLQRWAFAAVMLGVLSYGGLSGYTGAFFHKGTLASGPRGLHSLL